jgi:myo-inositol 2-dehydrogenase/D-chiro-inositol 1-dehydrogenase
MPPPRSGDRAETIFRRLETCRSDRTAASSDDWDEACRALEIEEAIERSSRRGRTIDLHHEQVSEEETFKGMMAVGGCAMLVWVLSMLLMAGLVEGLQLPLRNTIVWRLWPLALILPLALFLLLQLLRLVFERPPRR